MDNSTIYFAGGCFWGTEKFFRNVPGVVETEVGYANSDIQHPSYQQVCTGLTNAAETVRVVYNPRRVTLPYLIHLYLMTVDPTSVNRQGGDAGTQYRTGIYTVSEADYLIVAESLRQAEADYASPIVVTRHNATEPPFDNAYWRERREGIYVDITNGQPLFLSTDKFQSECGWPSFSRPINDALISRFPDNSAGIQRVEVRSRVGDAHLGHVFNDGPRQSGGLRYCINSASLRFIPRSQMEEQGYADYLPLLPD